MKLVNMLQHDMQNSAPFNVSIESILNPADRAFYDSLPEQVTIWQGGDFQYADKPSYSTDRAVAESFAKGHRGYVNPRPEIWRKKVTKRFILMVHTDRQESEVVIYPRRARWGKGDKLFRHDPATDTFLPALPIRD